MSKTVFHKRSGVGLFGTVRVLTLSALFCGMSVVFGMLLSVDITPSLRISLTNFPIILSGVSLGPVVGTVVGVGSDLLGCVIHGYALNPFVTVGAGCVGLYAGVVSLLCRQKTHPLSLLGSVAASHVAGSIVVKTAGLYWAYRTPLSVLIPSRMLTYLLTGAVEYLLLWLLLKSNVIRKILFGGHAK